MNVLIATPQKTTQKHQATKEWKESLYHRKFSDCVLTEHETKVLDKGLNFVPTTEKLDRPQIKNDLEKVGRDIKLTIFYQNELSPFFSEKPAFKVASSWTPPISDVQLELYLSEIEDKLININEGG